MTEHEIGINYLACIIIEQITGLKPEPGVSHAAFVATFPGGYRYRFAVFHILKNIKKAMPYVEFRNQENDHAESHSNDHAR